MGERSVRKVTDAERKEINLEMLKYLDRVCREQNIEYSLTGGTLLGAIRHGGFIPWDDDADVFLARPEYERLNDYLRTQDEYYWVTAENDDKFYFNFGRLMDKRTHIVNEGTPDISHYGLFIDVCVVDGLPENALLRKWHIFKIRFCYRARRCISIRNKEFCPKNPVKRLIKASFRFVCGLFGYKWWMNRIEALIRRYPFDTGTYVGDVMSNYGSREVMHRSSFDSYCDVPFENCVFRMICGWEEYLTNIYGDYMTPPPEDQRRGHCMGTAYWLD